jgi:hypothetical protein
MAVATSKTAEASAMVSFIGSSSRFINGREEKSNKI